VRSLAEVAALPRPRLSGCTLPGHRSRLAAGTGPLSSPFRAAAAAASPATIAHPGGGAAGGCRRGRELFRGCSAAALHSTGPASPGLPSSTQGPYSSAVLTA
jgi:hypothetical protein